MKRRAMKRRASVLGVLGGSVASELWHALAPWPAVVGVLLLKELMELGPLPLAIPVAAAVVCQ